MNTILNYDFELASYIDMQDSTRHNGNALKMDCTHWHSFARAVCVVSAFNKGIMQIRKWCKNALKIAMCLHLNMHVMVKLDCTLLVKKTWVFPLKYVMLNSVCSTEILVWVKICACLQIWQEGVSASDLSVSIVMNCYTDSYKTR